MNTLFKSLSLPAVLLLLASCGGDIPAEGESTAESATEEAETGPNGGRLLRDGDFAIELTIYESGVPPEYRAWAYEQEEPLPLGEVDLTVILTRLGDERNVINFHVAGDHLKGDTVVYEPHSFIVTVEASWQGKDYEWEYESLEGRTTISPQMSRTFGIETETAGPATIRQYLNVTGTISAREEYTRQISARFKGLVQDVRVRVGDTVEPGDPLVTVESNESLTAYTIDSPIAGVVTGRYINPGEQTRDTVLLEIMDTSSVWAKLSIFPDQRAEVSPGDTVTVTSPLSGSSTEGVIASFDRRVSGNQAITARVALDNTDGGFPPGIFVEGRINVANTEVPLAVKRDALQAFRDFTVVFAKVGNTYEVRMLDLGLQDDQWVEVLGGLDPGTEYVTTNSYILKADVEKSGATHDH